MTCAIKNSGGELGMRLLVGGWSNVQNPWLQLQVPDEVLQACDPSTWENGGRRPEVQGLL